MRSASNQQSGGSLADSAWTESVFRSLAENAVVGIYILKDSKFYYVNDKFAQMLGYERQEMLGGLTIFDVVIKEDQHQIRDRILQTLSGKLDQVHYERMARCKDGTFVDVEVFVARMELDGEMVVSGVVLDVARRSKLEKTADFTSMSYRHSDDAVVVTDANGVILTINPAFSDITGYLLDDVIGQRLDALISRDGALESGQPVWETVSRTAQWQGVVQIRHKSGETHDKQLSIRASYNPNGLVRCHIGLFSDENQQEESSRNIWHSARSSQLAVLPNRKLFCERFEQKILACAKAGTNLTLLYLGLDSVYEASGSHQRAAGGELHDHVATRLGQCVRQSDTVAQLSDNEFCLIIDEATNEEQVDRVCAKIVQTLAGSYELGGGEGYVSVSLGVAFYPTDALSPDGLIGNAGLAMRAARKLGSGQYCYFTPGMHEDADVQHQLMQDLVGAQDAGQLHLYYQPVVDLRSGRVTNAEALIRWEHPVHGLIGPDSFIPHAEDSGLITGIGNWVFHEAARQVAEWRAQFIPGFCVAVNVSPAQLRDDGLSVESWLATLQKHGLPGDSVVIEITERLLMDAAVGVLDKLLALREAGVRVALDDFGTGYSSLSYLKKFHMDFIKIDQSFVRNLGWNPDDRAVCGAIVMMAHRLGLRAIAEGVETPEQCRLLMAMGCDYGQGYLFSKPLPPARFVELVTSPLAAVTTHAQPH